MALLGTGAHRSKRYAVAIACTCSRKDVAMSRSRVLSPGAYAPPASVKEPLLTRSLAGGLAIGAPVGIVLWLAVQQLPNITWALNQLMQRAGQ
jgi:hypothetical protein